MILQLPHTQAFVSPDGVNACGADLVQTLFANILRGVF